MALYFLLRRMLGEHSGPAPLVVALLFVFHPVHTEVVATIQSRDDLLA